MSNPVIGLFIILLISALSIEQLFSQFSKEIHESEHVKVVYNNRKALTNEFKTNKSKKYLKSLYYQATNDCQRGNDAQRNPAIEIRMNTSVQNSNCIALVVANNGKHAHCSSKLSVHQQFNNITNQKTQYSISGNYKMINQGIFK